MKEYVLKQGTKFVENYQLVEDENEDGVMETWADIILTSKIENAWVMDKKEAMEHKRYLKSHQEVTHLEELVA